MHFYILRFQFDAVLRLEEVHELSVNVMDIVSQFLSFQLFFPSEDLCKLDADDGDDGGDDVDGVGLETACETKKDLLPVIPRPYRTSDSFLHDPSDEVDADATVLVAIDDDDDSDDSGNYYILRYPCRSV